MSHWTRPRIDFVDPRTLPFVEMRSRGELPHLYKEGGSYFVTFRLWDAVKCHSDSCGAAETAAPQVNFMPVASHQLCRTWHGYGSHGHVAQFEFFRKEAFL